jgi:hypothetical protein
LANKPNSFAATNGAQSVNGIKPNLIVSAVGYLKAEMVEAKIMTAPNPNGELILNIDLNIFFIRLKAP